MCKVAEYEATTFSIFYNNSLFLALVIIASFYILSVSQPAPESLYLVITDPPSSGNRRPHELHLQHRPVQRSDCPPLHRNTELSHQPAVSESICIYNKTYKIHFLTLIISTHFK